MQNPLSMLIVISLLAAQFAGQASAAPAENKSNHKQASRGLIPPPPPVAPLGGQMFYVGGPAFMSLDEMKKHRVGLVDQLSLLKKTLEDGDRRVSEKRERAQLFESLYKEGVVSKRELESAEDAAVQAVHQIDMDKQKATSLQNEIDQIDAILKQHEKPAKK